MGKDSIDLVVLPECSRSIILGNDFLHRTKSLTAHWHRLKQKAVPPENFSCVHILGDSLQCIAGKINKLPVHALPATGCDINLVSERYLHSRNLGYKIDKEAKKWIRLTDGRLVETNGEIVLSWRFGSETWLNSWPSLHFSVLLDCPYDVVLGQKLLYDSNAFLRYRGCFRQTTPNANRLLKGGIAFSSAITLAFQRKPGITDALKATGDSSIIEELNRRAAVDHEISKKHISERLAAWEAEQDRRTNWNSGVKSNDATNGDDHLPGVDVSTHSLASSIKEHSFLAGDHTSSGLDSHSSSDEGSDSGGDSDWGGGGDGGDGGD